MRVPERIGRYQVLAELGQGAMGTVYRGRDARLDRDVAVDVMSKGVGSGPRRRCGFVIRENDPRLRALFREVMQQP